MPLHRDLTKPRRRRISSASKSRRTLLANGALAAGAFAANALGQPASAEIDLDSLGISRKDLGLPPAPPKAPVDPKEAAKLKAHNAEMQAKLLKVRAATDDGDGDKTTFGKGLHFV